MGYGADYTISQVQNHGDIGGHLLMAAFTSVQSLDSNVGVTGPPGVVFPVNIAVGVGVRVGVDVGSGEWVSAMVRFRTGVLFDF